MVSVSVVAKAEKHITRFPRKKCAPVVDASFAEGFIYSSLGTIDFISFWFFLQASPPSWSKQLSGNRRSTGFGSLFVWVKFNILTYLDLKVQKQ